MKGVRKGLSRDLLCPSWPSAPTGRINPRKRRKQRIGANFGEWYQKRSISYHSPLRPLIGSRHMNQTYLPSGNHYHLTFQPHAVYRFNWTERGGRKKSSSSRKWRPWAGDRHNSRILDLTLPMLVNGKWSNSGRLEK